MILYKFQRFFWHEFRLGNWAALMSETRDVRVH